MTSLNSSRHADTTAASLGFAPYDAALKTTCLALFDANCPARNPGKSWTPKQINPGHPNVVAGNRRNPQPCISRLVKRGRWLKPRVRTNGRTVRSASNRLKRRQYGACFGNCRDERTSSSRCRRTIRQIVAAIVTPSSAQPSSVSQRPARATSVAAAPRLCRESTRRAR